MIFSLVTTAFIVTGLLIGYLMTARPWWARFGLRETAGVALVLTCGTRYHRRMLAMVLRARTEAAVPLPVLLPEKTLVGRSYLIHSREHLEQAVAQLSTEMAAACEVAASTGEEYLRGLARLERDVRSMRSLP